MFQYKIYRHRENCLSTKTCEQTSTPWCRGLFPRSCYASNLKKINNQLVASKAPSLLVLYGIRLLAPATLWSSRPMRAEPRYSSTNESGAQDDKLQCSLTELKKCWPTTTTSPSWSLNLRVWWRATHCSAGSTPWATPQRTENFWSYRYQKG